MADEVKRLWVIFRQGVPLIIVEAPELSLAGDLLNWYADIYDFERRKLSATTLELIRYEPQPDPVPGVDYCPACGFTAIFYRGGVCERCHMEDRGGGQ